MNLIKKTIAFLLTLVMIITCVPSFAVSAFAQTVKASQGAKSAPSMVVSVSNSRVTVKISGVGTSGAADVIRMNANEYYSGDKISGVSAEKSTAGTKVGTYICPKADASVSFARYALNGTDYLYSKYYVVQNGKILYGPVYASEIYSPVGNITFDSPSKKGVFTESHASYDYVKDLGASHTVANVNVSKIFYPNEDKSGKAIDNSKRTDAIPFESNGKMYYFNKKEIEMYDAMISKYSQAKVNVSLILIAVKTNNFDVFPYSLVYTEKNQTCMGINTSNDKGRDYWIAALEFLAQRYSKSAKTGLVNNFVLGNEIDYAFAYNRISDKRRESLDTYMEEYSRLMRLANLSVKKYCSDMTVTIPITHSWAVSGWTNTDFRSDMYNSYAPKEMLDWLNKYTKKRGDYDWAVAPHCYGANLPQSRVTEIDTGMIPDWKYIISDDFNTSHYLTMTNLELIEQYLEQDNMLVNGKTRDVYLTESGVSSCFGASNNNAYMDYENQAAYISYFYYKASQLDCIKALDYYRLQDHESEAAAMACFGLLEPDGKKKIAYDVYKFIDTEKSFEYSNKYLDRIRFKKDGIVYSKADGNINSYFDAMDIVGSGFDWKSAWDVNKIMRRNSNEGDFNYRSIKTNKTQYAAGEDIIVTANGRDNDWVGIYKADDNVNPQKENGKESIYWYYTDKTNGNKNHVSGRPYAIQVYGEMNKSRVEDGALPAGKYKVVLFAGNGYNIADEIFIEITGTASAEENTIKTNKSDYFVGEDIIVTAAGDINKWVGIYKKDDKYGPTTVPGNVTSIYWYYVNKEGYISGNSVIMQSTSHNSNSSNPGTVLTAGDYVIYLFDESRDDSYILVDKTEITIKENIPDSLLSVSYNLENETDGFANGKVTVHCAEDNIMATDCVLYWADNNGKLDGYGPLAKFKLKGVKTVFDMYSNTIIPEGATKLIAYASNGNTLSRNFVECSLPENSAYALSGDVLTEFQVISDIHITTDEGAKGDVKYSNEHFKMLLNDINNNSKNSTGIFINGDIANSGDKAEFEKLKEIYTSVPGSPKLHLGIGNHDWLQNNPNNQFQSYVNYFNSDVKTDKVYYDEWVNGYHFIHLGQEENNLHVNLSSAQLKWLDALLAKDNAENPNKPVFVFLHQSMKNTVSGSFDGEGWNGVDNEEALKNVIKKYGQVVMFNGHSHWELDSKGGMFAGSSDTPTVFNDASAGYLWSGYNKLTGEYKNGSQGYYVRVYEDKIVVLGRDFVNGVYLPSAVFVVDNQDVTSSRNAYSVGVGTARFNLNAYSKTNGVLSYESSNPYVATVDALGNVNPRRNGVAYITISADSTNTKSVGKKTVKVTVNKLNQSVSAKNITKTYGDSPFSLGAKSGAGTPLSYKSSNTKAVVVDSKGKVTIKGAGTAKITVTAASNYKYNSAYKTVTVTVNKAPQTISAKSIKKTLSSKSFSLGAKVTKGNGKLSYTQGNKKSITVSKYGNIKIKAIGTTTIRIKAAGTNNYKTTYKDIKVVVVPNKVSVTSLKKKGTKITLKWKRDKKVDGYQIQYSTSSKFKNAKTVNISKNSTTSKSISKLKKNKTYYVRIRSHRKPGRSKTRYYSDWTVKKIKL